MKQETLLKVSGLKMHFDAGKGKTVKAVDGISFHIKEGETFGLVGESGCGKSTTGRVLLRLYEPTEGGVQYRGKHIHKLTEAESFRYNRKIQMIFQDPYASLNPRLTVRDILLEPMEIHGLYGGRKGRLEKVDELLESVGLNRAFANRYPHEFSGGQRQRIGIARALALEPEFIVADEPISALDVSVQAQVVNLLKKLQKEKGLTFLFIAHDLSMVKHISDRIGVMYLGHMVEITASSRLYQEPLHPYTQALLSAIPIPDPDIEDKRKRIILKGELPSPINPPSGCVFRTRCPAAMSICTAKKPVLKEAEEGHYVACHLYEGEVKKEDDEMEVTLQTR
ncbi:ATP-binding cassette domain-containing protein [Bacillus sonorensis]|uniref:ABC transporter ATP-binding protein n=1 Tax=Bacillus sonorensis TaxID=119858 RepID=UPI002DB74C63|nr:oligopeptide/dipeptide ABC transporter ATP-binding protein [Bacillus sonorensis]MEC1352986.1 ATP-binding cassette domain-containing protein [Bacillus sonorensis]MEC1426149.1 ATP-binding cassette domain-containing protein [Bacillus sonorensis]